MTCPCFKLQQLRCNNVKHCPAGSSMCSKWLLLLVSYSYHDQYTNFLRSAYDSSTNKHKQLGCSSAAPDNMFSHILCPACSSKMKASCCCFCRLCKDVQGEPSCTSSTAACYDQHSKVTDCVHLLQSCGLVQIFEALFCVEILKLTWHRIAALHYSFQLRLTFSQAEF